jgi:hypothetical protein
MGGGGVLGAPWGRVGGVLCIRAGGTLGVVGGCCGAGWAAALKASNALAAKALRINFISNLISVYSSAGSKPALKPFLSERGGKSTTSPFRCPPYF